MNLWADTNRMAFDLSIPISLAISRKERKVRYSERGVSGLGQCEPSQAQFSSESEASSHSTWNYSFAISSAICPLNLLNANRALFVGL